MDTNNILTIGIDYRLVHGGVAAVESVYSTFYEPFNHVATVVDYGQVRKLFAFFKAYGLFWKWMLFHKEIKIVHVHGASDASFWRKRIFINLAKMFGKKVVFHCHGAEFKRFANQNLDTVKETLDKCDVIIALSESWREWFQDTFNHPSVVVVKNVVPQPHVAKIVHEKFVLLFLGRLGKRKGIYDLMDVLADHKAEFDGKLKFLYGGDGDVKQLQAIIKDKGLENIAEYHGWVNGEKKERLLNLADAYILPSYNEGLPISVLEAMSYSLPIISTKVGGIPEILKNGKNGYLIEPGDKDAIWLSIKELMEDKINCVKMGASSKEIVKEHLPEFVETQLRQIYCSLFGGGKSAKAQIVMLYRTSFNQNKVA